MVEPYSTGRPPSRNPQVELQRRAVSSRESFTTLIRMPGSAAKRGDIYNVAASALMTRDFKPQPRRMVCVSEQPQDALAWKAMSRTTTAGKPGVDLFSPADSTLSLTLDGWWSWRFLRAVKKRYTGDPHQCAYLATMVDPLRKAVLDHYMNRPR